jgi:hypothetical protein
MALTEHLELPDWGVRLELPAGWVLDDSGRDQGTMVVRAPDGWTDGFRPNLVVTRSQETADPGLGQHRMLAGQEAVEPILAEQLRDYRLIHLGMESMGRPAVAAVHRLAIYTTAQGLPVTMQQWLAPGSGGEITMTFTFPTADTALGLDGGRALAEQLEWKETTI